MVTKTTNDHRGARRQRRQFNVACLDDLKTVDPLLTYLCDNKQVYMYSQLRGPAMMEQIASQYDPTTMRSPIKINLDERLDHRTLDENFNDNGNLDGNLNDDKIDRNFNGKNPLDYDNQTDTKSDTGTYYLPGKPASLSSRALSGYSTDSEEALFDQLECILRVKLPPSTTTNDDNITMNSFPTVTHHHRGMSYATPSIIHPNSSSFYLSNTDPTEIPPLERKEKLNNKLRLLDAFPSRLKEKTLVRTRTLLSPFMKSTKSPSLPTIRPSSPPPPLSLGYEGMIPHSPSNSLESCSTLNEYPLPNSHRYGDPLPAAYYPLRKTNTPSSRVTSFPTLMHNPSRSL